MPKVDKGDKRAGQLDRKRRMYRGKHVCGFHTGDAELFELHTSFLQKGRASSKYRDALADARNRLKLGETVYCPFYARDKSGLIKHLDGDVPEDKSQDFSISTNIGTTSRMLRRGGFGLLPSYFTLASENYVYVLFPFLLVTEPLEVDVSKEGLVATFSGRWNCGACIIDGFEKAIRPDTSVQMANLSNSFPTGNFKVAVQLACAVLPRSEELFQDLNSQKIYRFQRRLVRENAKQPKDQEWESALGI